MTIAETAKLAGVSYNTIHKLYNDKTKVLISLRLANCVTPLDCTPNDLFKYTLD